jgi:hypothetical protein
VKQVCAAATLFAASHSSIISLITAADNTALSVSVYVQAAYRDAPVSCTVVLPFAVQQLSETACAEAQQLSVSMSTSSPSSTAAS